MPDTRTGGEQKRFPSTKWGLVRLAARNTDSMDSIIRVYWKPLYFFVRQKGFDNETAKDLVQGFLTLFIERKAFARADPAKGRFRTLLLASLENHVKDCLKESARAKRGGGKPLLSLDFEEGEREFAAESDPSDSPDFRAGRAWARSLFIECISRIEASPAHVLALRLHMAGEGYGEILRRTDLTEPAARSAIHRLYGQFRDILIRHLASTAVREEDLPGEIEDFIVLLR